MEYYQATKRNRALVAHAAKETVCKGSQRTMGSETHSQELSRTGKPETERRLIVPGPREEAAVGKGGGC